MKNFKIIFLSIILISIFGCTKTLTLNELCKKTDADKMLTVAEWYYCGSEDGYHYFYNQEIGFGSGPYRIKENELKLTQTFPFTKDKNQWILLPWGAPHPDHRNKVLSLVGSNQDCFNHLSIDLNNSDIVIDPEHGTLQLLDNATNPGQGGKSEVDS